MKSNGLRVLWKLSQTCSPDRVKPHADELVDGPNPDASLYHIDGVRKVL